MGTTMYFGDRKITDAASEKGADLEVGTSGFAGNGPQMYLNLNGESVLLSHGDAEAFCQAIANVARYFGYKID